MADNPQPPQARIDELIRRIENDNAAYTTSVTQVTGAINRRNEEVVNMLTQCMTIANDAIELVRQNTNGATIQVIQTKLQELERAYAGQNTQVAGDYQELLDMINRMQNDGVQGTAQLQQQLADIRRRFEQVQAQEREAAGLPQQPPGAGLGGYGNNKRKPKKKHHGGYAYPGSPNKSSPIRSVRKSRPKTKTRRKKRSLAGKRVSSKSRGKASGPSKRSTRRRHSRR